MTKFVEGRQCYLRAVMRGDYTQCMATWLADREATRYLVRGTFPATTEDLTAAYDQMRASPTDAEFTVVANENDITIGVTGLHAFDWLARSAEFRIFLGDRRFWARGIGTEVTHLMVAYGFDVLNLNKVWLGVNVENLAAETTYRSAGFSEEGVLRQEVFRNGRYYDVRRMSILHDEYDSAAPKWPLYPDLCRQFRGSD